MIRDIYLLSTVVAILYERSVLPTPTVYQVSGR